MLKRFKFQPQDFAMCTIPIRSAVRLQKPTLFFPILKLCCLFNCLFQGSESSAMRRILVAFVLNNSHRKQGQMVQSFPAFLRVLFLELRALARILFLADLAFLSLNLKHNWWYLVGHSGKNMSGSRRSNYLSRSVRPALLALMAILLAQVEFAQVSST